MEIDIIYSLDDPVGVLASRALVERLRAKPRRCPYAEECFSYERGLIAGYSGELLNLDILDVSPRSELRPVIALSRHASRECRGTLSVHHTGNPTSTVAGGKPFKLAVSYPALAKALLVEYSKATLEMKLEKDYELTLEATHHGPTETSKPLVFIEVGSCEKQWRDSRAILALVTAVSNVVNNSENIPACTPAVGLGGPHYPRRFTKAMLETELCFGHIISKHQLSEAINENTVIQALERSYPEPSRVIIVEKSSTNKVVRDALQQIASIKRVLVEYW
ncbi:MAG: D-aminoacyl-tRNA deacylase [Acidilobaceae archaeon]